MRISVHTLGSRGDVQPFIALALALQARGHAVQLAAPAQFTNAIASRGIAAAELPGGFLDLLGSAQGRAALEHGSGFGAGFRLLRHVGPLMQDLLTREWEHARDFDPDLLVAHPKSIAIPYVAQALGCPYVLASPVPGFTPTREFPTPMLPFANLGPLNRPSHALMTHSAGVLFARSIRRWRRRTLGNRAHGRRPAPVATLYAHSRHLLPRPADYPPSVSVTGFWFLDSPNYEPPAELAAFLEKGSPPIAVGFGSMPAGDPVRLTRTIVQGLALAGKRGLLIGAGGALVGDGLPSTCFFVDEVPYDSIFGRVGATLHHGGAGSTASSMRAGVPIVACPFMADQPFWARRIELAGLGPRALDRHALTPEAIAAAIELTGRQALRARAGEMRRLVAREGGVEEAADRISAIG